ncbi:MAG: hypothetical protein PHR06_10935 [Candidatus Cloacimonetes bacterium]|nr:hypothetical protein [Candidatus Cloacimonadota bacterium]
MDLNNIKSEINSAISKVFDKVEEVTKVSKTKLKISGIKNKIKDTKLEIGEFIYRNKNLFNNEEIDVLLQKIQNFESEIAALESELQNMKEEDDACCCGNCNCNDSEEK